MLEYLISDEFVCSGDRVAVGVSGGADSMLLLWALFDKQKKVDFYIKVIHVNHNLRGSESDSDAQFVSDFCKKKNIPCEVISVDVLSAKLDAKTGIEETARNLRYEAIYKVMKRDKLNKLFLAHHKNDQVESVLMHLFRGSGISGACGMRENDKIFRPLLNLKKEEILNLAKEHGIKYVLDSSNLKNDASRNCLRNVVIPEIEKIYPNAVNAIFEFSKKCNIVQEYIEKLAKNGSIIEEKGSVTLKGEAFEGESFVVRERIKMAFEALGVLCDIEEKHYKLVEELNFLQVGSSLDLPHKVLAKRVYSGVRLCKASLAKHIEQNVPFVLGKTKIEGYGTIACEMVEAEKVIYGDGSLYLDLAKIPIGSVWRSRQPNDVFAKLGTGTKKLNDYFTDKKIDIETRSTLPVLASGSRVLLVAENDIGEGVKIDSETEQIVKIQFLPD